MAAVVDITLSDDQLQGTELVLERWLRQPGERVRLHEPLLEINTDKAVVEIPAPASGVLRDIVKPANDPIRPGDVLGRIEVDPETDCEPDAPAREPHVTLAGASGSAPASEQRLSPAVRELVKKYNVDLSQITGTGKAGRITYQDVQNYLQRLESGGQPSPPVGKMVPHSPLRRRIAQHMVESLIKTAPHVTAVFDADLSAVVAHRKAHQEAYRQKGVRLTYTAYFIAAAAKALPAVPEVNSRWHEDALEIFSDCNIGIAMAVEGGLLVPVIHQAQTLDLFGIAGRLEALTGKARAGKLDPADLRHGTLTITNHGVSGSLIATPIIHQPQTAILGIGKIEKRLVVIDEKARETLRIQPMAYITLTIDHRALDGFQANAFLTKFVEVLVGW
jgi:2-oxoglutarate dehydrogenase E2 component (dihydrolipoamide succinyltransferase)